MYSGFDWVDPFPEIYNGRAAGRGGEQPEASDFDTSSIGAISGSPPGSSLALDDLRDWISDVHEASDDDDALNGDASEGAPDIPECSHCHTRWTPLWRRNKDGARVCNACWLYQRLHGEERPLPPHATRSSTGERANHDDDALNDDTSEAAPDVPECSHCHRPSTTLWGRNKDDGTLCNPCGLYQHLHGEERPL
ncbi:hypothetical protein C8R44DRAFT_665204 [Mycena epipterygia]|nr:hypothetical protein C8R44DRAFT_665204 [Mycena epipterygia]